QTQGGAPTLPPVNPPPAVAKPSELKPDPTPPQQTLDIKSLVDTGKPAPMPPNNPWVASPPNAESFPGRPVASTESLPPNNTTPAPVQKAPLPPLQYVNHPRVVLEYELNKVGPSGVGKVELWYTTNDGQSWELCADDPRVEGATSGGRHQRAIDLPG